MKIIKKLNLKKGFTLIELLIVIAIIGVLATLLMANFVGVRQRARDAQRKSDLKQIQSALELYRADNGSYPADASFPACGLLFGAEGVGVYMQKVPCDPSTGSSYTYTSDGNTYSIVACLENASDAQKDETNTCSPGSSYSYTVQNP